MLNYIIKRLLLIIPTLFAIMLLNFFIIEGVAGGPIEQLIEQIESGSSIDNLNSNLSASRAGEVSTSSSNSSDMTSSGLRGLSPEYIKQLEQQFGFDKPRGERFFSMVINYLTFDFGDSFFRESDVIELILEKMPVSLSLGFWTLFITYIVAIPLGIRKAIKAGSSFDIASTTILVLLYAIPSFILAIFLIVLFAGGSFVDWFPLRGLISDNFDELSTVEQIGDYFWHLALPLFSMVIGGFTGLALLTRNSFLDQLSSQYVLTARAKGCGDKRVLYKHVFRNAMLIIIAGFPAAFIAVFFTGSMLIETIFSLDGLGLLGFEAMLSRDYPIVFGSLYIFTLLGLVVGIISDLMYVLVDPRIDFESR